MPPGTGARSKCLCNLTESLRCCRTPDQVPLYNRAQHLGGPTGNGVIFAVQRWSPDRQGMTRCGTPTLMTGAEWNEANVAPQRDAQG
jgi:hypothetical protein